MKNNFFSSIKGLYNQIDKENNFLIFKNDDNFFRIEFSERQLKKRKRICKANFFISFMIYSVFIKYFFLNYNIYSRIAISYLTIYAFMTLGSTLQAVYYYFYYLKEVKKDKAKIFKDKNVINREFYNKENHATQNEDINDCKHKPKIKIKDIVQMKSTETNAFLCKKCGLPIKLNTYDSHINKLVKSEFLTPLIILIVIEIFFFAFISLRKGIMFLFETAFPNKDTLFFGRLSYFNLFSYIINAIFLFIVVYTLIYYVAYYFGKFKLVENETENSSNNDILQNEL